MPEPIKVKCKCGWESNIYPGKIVSVICPKCGNKVWLKKPMKVLAKPKTKGKKAR